MVWNRVLQNLESFSLLMANHPQDAATVVHAPVRAFQRLRQTLRFRIPAFASKRLDQLGQYKSALRKSGLDTKAEVCSPAGHFLEQSMFCSEGEAMLSC